MFKNEKQEEIIKEYKVDAILQRGILFNNNIPANTTEIIFTDIKAPISAILTDVSEVQDMSVVAWSEGTTMYVSSQEEGKPIYANQDCSYMFESIVSESGTTITKTGNTLNIKLIEFNNFNASRIENARSMFINLGYNQTVLDLKGLNTWDTSNLITTYDMFFKTGYNTTNLKLDLSNWNMKKVTDMSYMFQKTAYNSTTFEIIGIETWETPNVTKTLRMFDRCGYNCTNIIMNLSKLDTSNIKTMQSMFSLFGQNTSNITIGDISQWDTRKVTDMSNMFSYNTGFKANYKLDLSNWNVDNVISYSGFNTNYTNITPPVWKH